jgi:hypothetical protein
MILDEFLRTLFWKASLLDGMRQKDDAPIIFDRSRKRICTVCEALENNFWV